MSENSKSTEIEIKAHVKEPSTVLSFLKENAKFKKKYFKKDVYFAREGDENINNMLRLRQEKGSYVFTQKTRKMLDKTEINEEREMNTSKGLSRKFLRLLTDVMGYSEYVRKEKKGKAYVYKDVLVELSEIKGLGYFVELELLDSVLSHDEQLKLLREVLSDIGVCEDMIEEKPYVKLLRDE